MYNLYNSHPDSQDSGDVWWPDIANTALVDEDNNAVVPESSHIIVYLFVVA